MQYKILPNVKISLNEFERIKKASKILFNGKVNIVQFSREALRELTSSILDK